MKAFEAYPALCIALFVGAIILMVICLIMEADKGPIIDRNEWDGRKIPRRAAPGNIIGDFMHLSKRALYFGIIAYSIALLVFQDWGSISALWLGKMVLDIGFSGMAFVRLAGDSLFADDEADDEVAIHAEDLAFQIPRYSTAS